MAGKLEQYSNVPVMTQSRVLHIVELTPPNTKVMRGFKKYILFILYDPTFHVNH